MSNSSNGPPAQPPQIDRSRVVIEGGLLSNNPRDVPFITNNAVLNIERPDFAPPTDAEARLDVEKPGQVDNSQNTAFSLRADPDFDPFGTLPQVSAVPDVVFAPSGNGSRGVGPPDLPAGAAAPPPPPPAATSAKRSFGDTANIPLSNNKRPAGISSSSSPINSNSDDDGGVGRPAGGVAQGGTRTNPNTPFSFRDGSNGDTRFRDPNAAAAAALGPQPAGQGGQPAQQPNTAPAAAMQVDATGVPILGGQDPGGNAAHALNFNNMQSGFAGLDHNRFMAYATAAASNPIPGSNPVRDRRFDRVPDLSINQYEFARFLRYAEVPEDKWKAYAEYFRNDPAGNVLAHFMNTQSKQIWNSAIANLLGSRRATNILLADQKDLLTTYFTRKLTDTVASYEKKVHDLQQRNIKLESREVDRENVELGAQLELAREEIRTLKMKLEVDVERQVATKTFADAKAIADLRTQNATLLKSQTATEVQKLKDELAESRNNLVRAKQAWVVERDAKVSELQKLLSEGEVARLREENARLKDSMKLNEETVKLTNKRDILLKTAALETENIDLKRKLQDALSSETLNQLKLVQEQNKSIADNYTSEITTLKQQLDLARRQFDIQKRELETKASDTLRDRTATLQSLNEKLRDEVSRLKATRDIEALTAMKQEVEQLKQERDLAKRELDLARRDVAISMESKWTMERAKLQQEAAKLREELAKCSESELQRKTALLEKETVSMRDELKYLRDAKTRSDNLAKLTVEDAMRKERSNSSERDLIQQKKIEELQTELAKLLRDGVGASYRDLTATLKEERAAAAVTEQLYKRQIENIKQAEEQRLRKEITDARTKQEQAEKDLAVEKAKLALQIQQNAQLQKNSTIAAETKVDADMTKILTAQRALVKRLLEQQDMTLVAVAGQNGVDYQPNRALLLQEEVAQLKAQIQTYSETKNSQVEASKNLMREQLLDGQRAMLNVIDALMKRNGALVEEKAAREIREEFEADTTVPPLAKQQAQVTALQERVRYLSTTIQEKVQLEADKLRVDHLAEKQSLLDKIQKLQLQLAAQPVNAQDVALQKRKLDIVTDSKNVDAQVAVSAQLNKLQERILQLENEKENLLQSGMGAVSDALKREVDTLKRQLASVTHQRDVLQEFSQTVPPKADLTLLTEKYRSIITTQERTIQELQRLDVRSESTDIQKLRSDLIKEQAVRTQEKLAAMDKERRLQQQLDDMKRGLDTPARATELLKLRDDLRSAELLIEEQKHIIKIKELELTEAMSKANIKQDDATATLREQLEKARQTALAARIAEREAKEKLLTASNSLSATTAAAARMAISNLSPNTFPITSAAAGGSVSTTAGAVASPSSAKGKEKMIDTTGTTMETISVSRRILAQVVQAMPDSLLALMPGARELVPNAGNQVALINFSPESTGLVELSTEKLWSFFTGMLSVITEPSRLDYESSYVSNLAETQFSCRRLGVSFSRCSVFAEQFNTYLGLIPFGTEANPQVNAVFYAIGQLRIAATDLMSVARDAVGTPDKLLLSTGTSDELEVDSGEFRVKREIYAFQFASLVAAFTDIKSTREIALQKRAYDQIKDIGDYGLATLFKRQVLRLRAGRPFSDWPKLSQNSAFRTATISGLLISVGDVAKLLFDKDDTSERREARTEVASVLTELDKTLSSLAQLLYHIYFGLNENRNNVTLVNLFEQHPLWRVAIVAHLDKLNQIGRTWLTRGRLTDISKFFTVLNASPTNIRLGDLVKAVTPPPS